MTKFDPIVSARPAAPIYNLGSSTLLHHVRSEQTGGAFSVVEFISEPGEGVDLHIHQHEEELVYLVEGQVQVTLGDQKMSAQPGTCALLPRNIPHGYVNTGDRPSRLLAVLLPGRLDQFFAQLSSELATDRSHEQAVASLCSRFGLQSLNHN